MKIKAEVDLSEMESDQWGTSVDGIIRQEILYYIKLEVKKAIKADTTLKKKIMEMQKEAAAAIIESIQLGDI